MDYTWTRAPPFQSASIVRGTMAVAYVRPLSGVARARPGELRVLIALEQVLFRESVRSALEREGHHLGSETI